MTYPQDHVIGSVIIVSLALSLLGLGERPGRGADLEGERRNRQKAILSGLGIIVAATLGNCLVQRKWDMSFMFEFLLARKTGGRFFRYLLPFGYLALSYGLQGWARGLKKKESGPQGSSRGA